MSHWVGAALLANFSTCGVEVVARPDVLRTPVGGTSVANSSPPQAHSQELATKVPPTSRQSTPATGFGRDPHAAMRPQP
jgi:hypothetical protein